MERKKSYSQCVVAALQNGYHCITFEGPGQERVILKQEIPFMYDWEKVVALVLDYVLNSRYHDQVFLNRIALMGISLGGYLAAPCSCI
jgi:alpha-beta hydrolase superfamily lysophospholipase